MNGYGRFIYANGDVFEGNFTNHKRNGPGRYFINRTGLINTGKWINDRFV